MSYRTSYRTELRNESLGWVMSKVLQTWARPAGLGWVGGIADDPNFHRMCDNQPALAAWPARPTARGPTAQHRTAGSARRCGLSRRQRQPVPTRVSMASRNCPVAVTKTAHWWPWDLPSGGHQRRWIRCASSWSPWLVMVRSGRLGRRVRRSAGRSRRGRCGG